jgi:hypothetical protein
MRLKTLENALSNKDLFVFPSKEEWLAYPKSFWTDAVIVYFEDETHFRVVRNKTSHTGELVDNPKMVNFLKREMIKRALIQKG